MGEPPLRFPEYDPEFEVWNHIESALDMARRDLGCLGPAERAVVEQVGEVFARLRKNFTLQPDQRDLMAIIEQLLANPWFRHAADLELATDGVIRASSAIDRYKELQTAFTVYQPSSKPNRYLAEAVRTFAFGFDGPCIAFCGAALERVLQDALERTGALPPGQSLDERTPSASFLLSLAKEKKLIRAAAGAAKHLLEQRDRVMHRHMWDEKIIKGIALQCVEDLAAVLRELPAISTEPSV